MTHTGLEHRDDRHHLATQPRRPRAAEALDRVCKEAEKAVDGETIWLLSDREVREGAGSRAGQMLLAVSAPCISTW